MTFSIYVVLSAMIDLQIGTNHFCTEWTLYLGLCVWVSVLSAWSWLTSLRCLPSIYILFFISIVLSERSLCVMYNGVASSASVIARCNPFGSETKNAYLLIVYLVVYPWLQASYRRIVALLSVVFGRLFKQYLSLLLQAFSFQPSPNDNSKWTGKC